MSYLIRRVLAKPRLILDEMCRLYRKFASYLRRVLFCINGPNMLLYFASKYTATAFLTEMFFPGVLNQVGKLRKFQGGGGEYGYFFGNYALLQNI